MRQAGLESLGGELSTRVPTLGDLDALVALEQRSYPSDEAASRETFEFRLGAGADCWVVGEVAGRLVGLVCGTRVHAARLDHASMHSHEPTGPNLCVHSVVVDSAHRRRGLGLALLAAYLEHVDRTLPTVDVLSLIAKEHLVGFYQRAGFELLGPSDVVHGTDPWFELRRQSPPVAR